MAKAKDITVAAIIPLYNGAGFIRESLGSVLAQTQAADEVIVVDDGSSDDGPAIVREIAQKAPVTLLSKPNGGQSSARNFGMRHSKSSHVALLDQDDVWYDDHLAGLTRPFREAAVRNLAFAYSNLDRIDRQGRIVAQRFLDDMHAPQPKRTLQDCIGRDMYVLPSASLMDRAAVLSVGGFDENLIGYEDDDLFVRLFVAGFGHAYVAESLGKWRIHAGSTTYTRKMARSRLYYMNKLIETFREPDINVDWVRDVIAPRFFFILFGDVMRLVALRDREGATLAWGDLKEVVPHLQHHRRRRMERVEKAVDWLLPRGHFGLARRFLRRGGR